MVTCAEPLKTSRKSKRAVSPSPGGGLGAVLVDLHVSIHCLALICQSRSPWSEEVGLKLSSNVRGSGGTSASTADDIGVAVCVVVGGNKDSASDEEVEDVVRVGGEEVDEARQV